MKWSDENRSLGNWFLARNFLKNLFWPLFLRVDCSQSQDASIKPLCRVCSQKLKLLWPCGAFFGFSEYSDFTTGLAPLEREKPCSYEFLIQNNFFIKKIISSNFSARGAPRAAVNHLTMQHGSPAWSSTPMVWLHLVTPLPIRVSGFSTCRLRLTLFLFWDLSNRIGPGVCRRNLLGRSYGGRF